MTKASLKRVTASEQIVQEVSGWPGVEVRSGGRGELSIRFGRRELGHLHGDRVAHFGFPKTAWSALYKQGRIDDHPVFPGKPGWGARRIEGQDDVHDVIELLRLNYDRAAVGTARGEREA